MKSKFKLYSKQQIAEMTKIKWIINLVHLIRYIWGYQPVKRVAWILDFFLKQYYIVQIHKSATRENLRMDYFFTSVIVCAVKASLDIFFLRTG